MNPVEAEINAAVKGNGASRERRVGMPDAQSLMTAIRTPVMVTNVPIIQRK